ncbi:ATP12-domain-containing protein [Trichodelitschia bisporula]|uniref:ATP12-domain-containing protein n=1 Tax=Trichodelitschia bisporula TaxID=703511 RepID=A0A6G1HJE1_9PEZI|nr:ATP12-domain-containing protein [Trichodelitschia bisporula]
MEALRPRLLASSLRPLRLRPCVRCLHTSPPNPATPIAHPTAPGPPPPPPQPEAYYDERLARRKRQAALLQKGGARPAEGGLQRRFWKNVSVREVEDGYQVLLDSRPVRTAEKKILVIPRNRPHLAAAIALEWDQLVSAAQALKTAYVPLTGLAARAVDIREADGRGDGEIREGITELMMRYLETDTLLCWAEGQEPEKDGRSLREMQVKEAERVVGDLTRTVWKGVDIRPVLEEGSIMPVKQAEETVEVIRGWIAALPAFELAGLERAVLSGKSLLVAARLVVEWSGEFEEVREKGVERFGIEEAVMACTCEVRWQTDLWGEVEDTHDVDREDLRRQFGSVVVLIHGE